MTPTQRVRTIQALLVAAVFAVVTPADAGAQAGQGGRGFLFRQPNVSLGLRTGYAVPRAGSELFTHTRDQLTVEKSDFAGGYIGGEIGVRLSDHFDLAFGVGYTSSITPSEFREWVDTDDLAIEQVTEFSTTPVTLSGKYYLTDRGRSIGRFAWVPRRMNAYVGGGVGLTFYRFEQSGDWVDFETLDIFTSEFTSRGRGTQLHALAGLDVSISKNFYLTGEGRYLWADAAIDDRFFEGFDDLDLTGLQFTVGISARF